MPLCSLICLLCNQLEAAHNAGKLAEIFVTGTAAIIQPVGKLGLPVGSAVSVDYDEVAVAHWLKKPPGASIVPAAPDEPFSLTARIYRAIVDIQYGHVDSEWSVPIGK